MKKILTGLFLLISFASFAQVDSSTLNVTFSLQQRDWAYVFDEKLIDITTSQGEAVYDQVKTGARANAAMPPTSQSSSDTVDARVAFVISAVMRTRAYSPTYLHFTRINTALRAATGPGSAWLKRQLDILDAQDDAESTRRTQRGYNRLKKLQ